MLFLLVFLFLSSFLLQDSHGWFIVGQVLPLCDRVQHFAAVDLPRLRVPLRLPAQGEDTTLGHPLPAS